MVVIKTILAFKQVIRFKLGLRVAITFILVGIKVVNNWSYFGLKVVINQSYFVPKD